MRRFPRRVVVIALLVLLVPAAAIAANGFDDVPQDNVFAADIQWLADAGVTKGCNPPANDLFCPSAAVTRQQMAAFMHRLAVNQVVDAATAKTAEDADTLDGMDSTEFARREGFRYFSLLAETMQPIDSTIGYDNTEASLRTTNVSSISGTATYIGQVDLPDGAEVVRIIGYGYDGTAVDEYGFILYRYGAFDTPVWTQMTDWVSSGFAWDGGTLVSEAAAYPAVATVDNLNYSYGIFVQLPANSSLSLLRFVVETN